MSGGKIVSNGALRVISTDEVDLGRRGEWQREVDLVDEVGWQVIRRLM